MSPNGLMYRLPASKWQEWLGTWYGCLTCWETHCWEWAASASQPNQSIRRCQNCQKSRLGGTSWCTWGQGIWNNDKEVESVCEERNAKCCGGNQVEWILIIEETPKKYGGELSKRGSSSYLVSSRQVGRCVRHVMSKQMLFVLILHVHE